MNAITDQDTHYVFFKFNIAADILNRGDNIFYRILYFIGSKQLVAFQFVLQLSQAHHMFAHAADSYPDILSGGEQQRVAIARALSHGPAVLLADEPTGNLDDATAELVLDLLDDLVRRSGGTMLIATHSETVASMCDRVLELHTGKLEERA